MQPPCLAQWLGPQTGAGHCRPHRTLAGVALAQVLRPAARPGGAPIPHLREDHNTKLLTGAAERIATLYDGAAACVALTTHFAVEGPEPEVLEGFG